MKRPNTCTCILTLFILFSLKCYSQTEAQAIEMLELVNDLRIKNGKNPVYLNDKLNLSAKQHSKDMANNNYFDHKGLNGSSFPDRIKKTTYIGNPRGENIAAGNASVANTFKQWVNSDGHRNNMLNSNINEMGIGYGFNSNANYRHYWTQVFAFNNSLSLEEVKTLNLVLYPNPVVSQLKINGLITTEEIFISNYLGQTILKTKVSKTNNTINVSQLSKGIYFLKLKNKTTFKFIKN